MSGDLPVLPPTPPRREHHASSLPALQRPLWQLDLQAPRVVAMDANILVDLAESCAKAAGVERSATLEQLRTGRLRVIISHQDVEPVASLIDPAQVIERVERSMEKRVKGNVRRAAALQAVWRTHLRPWVHVLNPSGCPASKLHADVMTRDPDDADLGLLAEIVGVDAFLSRDDLAFGPTFLPVIPSVQRQPGDPPVPGVLDILAAWRNEGRVRQHTSTLALPPLVVAAGVKEGIWALGRTLKVPPLALLAGGLIAAVAGAKLLPPATKATLKQGVKFYLDHTMAIQQTADEQAYAKALAALCEVHPWPEATDFRVQAARHLARARQPVDVATLAELGEVTARTAGMRMRRHPGLFQEWEGGQWSLAGCQADLEAT